MRDAPHRIVAGARQLCVPVLAGALLLLAGCSAESGWSLEKLTHLFDTTPAAPKTAKGETPHDPVVHAQKMLDRLGYTPGPIDGIAGPRTRQAITSYQADAGLPQDGQVTEALVDRLLAAVKTGTRGAGDRQFKSPTRPEYALGSTFVYSDGRVETVAGLDDGKVLWVTNRGVKFTAYTNFLLPRLTWTSGTETGRRVADAPPDFLWPLKAGRRAGFTARAEVQYHSRPDNPRRSVERWDCRTGGMDRLSVVAGTFDTVKIQCRRDAGDDSPNLTRIWHYAPAVRHYVRVNDYYDAVEMDRHVELVAVQPGSDRWPPALRAGLDRKLQHALDTLADGAQTVWNNSAIETRVTIRPMARFQRGDGARCRTFVQIWSGPKWRRNYPGSACLNASGRWSIPGLDGGLASGRSGARSRS